ncbi:MAG: hypothetical protein EOO17_05910 [Chloroflexi bacterium]|nr:MAG: hypothetical protein EOO17_05910 [Chloroflexota bacterium]
MKRLITLNAVVSICGGVVFLLSLIFSSGGMGDIMFIILLIPVFLTAVFILPFNIIYIPFYIFKYRPSLRVVILGVIGILASFYILTSYIYPWVKLFTWDIPAESAQRKSEEQARADREYSAISKDDAKKMLTDCRLSSFAYYYGENEHQWIGVKDPSGVELRTRDGQYSMAIDTKLNSELVPEARRARESRSEMNGCQPLSVLKDGSDELSILKYCQYAGCKNLPY